MNPKASVVIAAYNMAEYLPRAIESALAQTPPDGPVEVIVVDDGSVDDTPTVIGSYGDRIRSLRQENRGTNTAVDRGIGMATGEFIGLLDADDEWPADRLRRHIATLEANPGVGLVHGDMEVIDPEGNVIQPSYFSSFPMHRPTGRVLGALLEGNFVSGGASTFRASLKAAFHPLMPEAAYHDWSIAACIACVAEIDIAPGIANRYRFRGGNDSLGRPVKEEARVAKREIEWRRWMHRNLLDDPSVTAEFVARAYNNTRSGLVAAAAAEASGPRGLLDPDPAAKDSVLRSLPDLGLAAQRSKALLRALAEDPFDGALDIELALALRHEGQLPVIAADEPLILFAPRQNAVLAWLGEVLKRPDLLRAFADQHQGTETTLTILAPPFADMQQLVRIFADDSLLASEACDVRVITEPRTAPGRAFLRSKASTVLTLGAAPEGYSELEPDVVARRLGHRGVQRGAVMRDAKPRAPRSRAGAPVELTIVIPTLDPASEHLRLCVAAVHAVTDAPHEVVIVDNGCPPQGFTPPVNTGVRAARSRYIVVMNDDVEPLLGWWEPLKETLDGGAAVAFPLTVDGQMRHDFAAWCFAMTSDTVAQFSVLPGQFFDPGMVIWYQDTDLLERLQAAGVPPVQVDDSNIRHVESRTLQGSDRVLRAWIDTRKLTDELNFRAKHPQVGDVATEWSQT
jgi:glycosyltransferase involved in cell wall biosynthesis